MGVPGKPHESETKRPGWLLMVVADELKKLPALDETAMVRGRAANPSVLVLVLVSVLVVVVVAVVAMVAIVVAAVAAAMSLMF